MTDVEFAQIAALAKCSFSPGSTAKSFVNRLAGYAAVDAPALAAISSSVAEATRKFTNARVLSDKERAFLDRLAHQYRRQIGDCLSVACTQCTAPAVLRDRSEVAVALDAFIEGRTVNEYAELVPAWRKAALARYNVAYGTTVAHPYEYATRCAPASRRAHTLGDVYCRLCGERLFSQVKQPHKLVASSDEAQRHLTICALQILAEMKPLVPPGHRALPFEMLWREDQR